MTKTQGTCGILQGIRFSYINDVITCHCTKTDDVKYVEHITILDAPKTATFQMRINPEVKTQLERLFANCGIIMIDAINLFFQQYINAGGLPFVVTQDSKEALRNQVITQLLTEIQTGQDSVKSNDDWISEEEMLERFQI